MTATETLRLLNMRIDWRRKRAIRYLEEHGFRFCVDFGIDNASAKAREHWARRGHKTRRRPV